MTTTIAPVTVEDLRASEVAIKRAERRVMTQKGRLAEQEAELLKEREEHAALVERYGKQHCPGNGGAA